MFGEEVARRAVRSDRGIVQAAAVAAAGTARAPRSRIPVAISAMKIGIQSTCIALLHSGITRPVIAITKVSAEAAMPNAESVRGRYGERRNNR